MQITKRLLRYVEFVANRKRLPLLGIAFLTFNLFILPSLLADIKAVSQGTTVLDLLPWYTPDEARQHLNIFGEEGRRLYLIAEWTADFVYPTVYGLFFAGFLFRLGGGTWSLLPIYSAMIDYSENIFVTILLLHYPGFNPVIGQIAALLTSLKWMFILSSIMMILVRIFILFAEWLKKRRMPSKL